MLVKVTDPPIRVQVTWARAGEVSTVGWTTSDQHVATIAQDHAKPDFADITIAGLGTVRIIAQGLTDAGLTLYAANSVTVADELPHGEIAFI